MSLFSCQGRRIRLSFAVTMDIFPLGHASFKIKGKSATVVTDPFQGKAEADIVLVSHDHPDHNVVSLISGEPFVVSGPGEYEIKGVTVVGVPSFHDAKKGEERGRNTIYKFTVDGVNFCHLGDLGHKLTEAQVELIGDVDVLFVPVGGFYTIDAETASEVVAQIEPYIVIPMHYDGEKLEPVEKFLKQMGVEGLEKQNKLSISKDKLPENTTIVVLE